MRTVRAAQAGQGGPVVIACVDLATADLGYPVDQLTAALQAFYDQHFKPIWGYDVRLYNTTDPKPSDWLFVYMDDADIASTLGYHDLTVKGQPISKVFVKDTLKAKQSVSVTACHELCEMVIDPLANLWAQAPDGKLWAYEMCDAVEEDTFLVNDIPMSNFVHPSYFEPFKHPAGTKFDHLGKLDGPFTMDAGGYSIVMQDGKIKNIFGSKAKEARFAEECRALHRSEYRRKHKRVRT
jgi:hypothetical protein